MVENIFESRIGHSHSQQPFAGSAKKKMHVDEIEVVDSVDKSSTSLCLYIM